jgi:hypothetical protein
MSENLKRWGGPAAMLGGALWIAYYVLFASLSAQHGKSLVIIETPKAQIVPLALLFAGGFAGYGVALWGLRALLNGSNRILGYIGALPATCAIAIALIAAVRLTGLLGDGNPMGDVTGMGVLSSSLGAIIIGIATLRARTLSGGMRFVPLIVGILTFPTIIGIGMLSAFGHAYLIDELPFALLGLAWIQIGRAMLVPMMRESTVPMVPAAKGF